MKNADLRVNIVKGEEEIVKPLWEFSDSGETINVCFTQSPARIKLYKDREGEVKVLQRDFECL